MPQYNEAKNKEEALRLYKQKAREHFQKEAASSALEDKDLPTPQAPIPKDVASQYKITQEDLNEARRASLDELSEDARESEDNRGAYSKWYGNLYAPTAPILDFDNFPPSPTMQPKPPTDPYPIATPPKEPRVPSPEQALQDMAFESALKEADTVPPPSVPPPPLSEPPPLPGPPLDFSKYPVPTMVSSESQSKRGLLGRIVNWLKDKISNAEVAPISESVTDEAKSIAPRVPAISDAPDAVLKATSPRSSISENSSLEHSAPTISPEVLQEKTKPLTPEELQKVLNRSPQAETKKETREPGEAPNNPKSQSRQSTFAAEAAAKKRGRGFSIG